MFNNVVLKDSIGFVMIALGLLFLTIGIYNYIKKVIQPRIAAKKKAIEMEHRSIVNQYSIVLNELYSINQNFSFYDINPLISYPYNCSSRREYINADYMSYMVDIIYNDMDRYYILLMETRNNAILYERYKEKTQFAIDKRRLETELYEKYPFFMETESQMIVEIVQEPVTDLHVVLSYSYNTPKGQKSYYHSYDLYTNEIQECYNEVIERKEHEKTAKYQREIMTDSLRYDVLKRDGFRCVLCGAEVKDGIKLHVDHIMPVSKGGKTEISNLRTLCDRCNLGKGAKYDPNGLN